MIARRCLIVDTMHPSIVKMLNDIGWHVHYSPDLSPDAIRNYLQGYQGLFVRSKLKVTAELVSESDSLLFIARAGAGLDNIDLEAMERKGIQVIHAAAGNKDAVGEFTLGLLLSLLRNIVSADKEVRAGIWERERNRGTELMGKTVGIIGYGNMGQAFARRLTGFSCNVLAYDKYKKGFSDTFVQEVPLKTLYTQADIISLHVPLTTETKQWVNAAFFNAFKNQILLLNTARGEIVNLEDALAALRNGQLRGAAFDVLENEQFHTLTEKQKKVFNQLAECRNVILTPHIAGWTFESHRKINVALVDKIKTLT